MRIYDISGVKYPSVTTVVDMMYPFDKAGFLSWCKRSKNNPDDIDTKSRRIGSMVHEWIQNRYHGIEFFDLPVRDKKEEMYKIGVEKLFKDWNILASEKLVYFNTMKHKPRYAGTLDAIAQRKGSDDIYYLDFKTYGAWRGVYKRNAAKLKKARTQISMYQFADCPDVDKSKRAVIVFKPDGDLDVEEMEFDSSFIPWMEENVAKIRELTGDKVERGI